MATEPNQKLAQIYKQSTWNLIIFGCVVIIASIIITGLIGYRTSSKAVVEKLKTSDLLYIIKSISTQIDGRIDKAKETSVLIADDPAIQAWFINGERNAEYKAMVIKRITDFSAAFNYSSIFMANDLTRNFWNNGQLVDVLTEKDPDDEWYFQAIASKQKINLNIDYNRELNDTFLWVNTIMGEVDKPIGVAGIGVNLSDLAKEFEKYKVGKNSNLWLVDKKGNISISEDIEHRGTNIEEYIPNDLKEEMFLSLDSLFNEPKVREYKAENGQIMDLIYQPLNSCEWLLVFQIPRQEVVAILDSLRINTIATIFLTIFAVIILFYLVSSRIANPYKKALLLNKELEQVIEARTLELTEKNTKLMDSIDYAKKIQEAILPTPEELAQIFNEYFVIWKPRDVVGGDFYWVKHTQDGIIIVVADCTGHGVPGAFMTMAVNSILNNIPTSMETHDPALIIKEVDRLLKQHLNRNKTNRSTDDGLEAGVCFIGTDRHIMFAGAGIDLYIRNHNGLNIVKGINKGIGYRKTDLGQLTSQCFILEEETVFYLLTDGYLDQNGGAKDHSLGRKRFINIVDRVWTWSLLLQKGEFLRELESYMGNELQRDDITVFGFKL